MFFLVASILLRNISLNELSITHAISHFILFRFRLRVQAYSRAASFYLLLEKRQQLTLNFNCILTDLLSCYFFFAAFLIL